MQSPGPWASNSGAETASATLGEMLAQEVLDSFNALASTPQTLLSGDVAFSDGSGSGAVPVMAETLSSTLGNCVPGKGSIAHESLHPICTPLSYGGHIEVDSNCHGMVVKIDSRSRTSSDVVRLQFFSSSDDMLNDRNPIRVMHGHVPDRAARARAKGMEFFKIEEADSTSFDVTSSSLEDALSISALDRINLPPPLVRHGSSSTHAVVNGGSSRHPSGTAHRVASSSEAAVRGLYEAQSRGVMSRWTRVKDAPALTQSTAFRSFALPGVHKLWFRFDAPPGAEKPPLKMDTLVGSLDHLPSGKLRANVSSSTGRDNSVHSEQDEDLSQEDMGLKALFTFFGADHVEGGAASPGVGSASMPRAESDEKSSSRSRATLELPGCLVAPDDVCLTRGKWFYEVTIDSLMEQAAGDDNLVRIGWAHLELASAVQGMHGLRPNERSSSWDTRASGSRQQNDDDARKPQVHESTRTLQGRSPLDSFKPAEHAVGWLHRSSMGTPISTAGQADKMDKDRSTDTHSPAAATMVPSESKSDGIPNPTEDAELARAEAEAKGVGFPIVGSDRGHLAVGLGRRGFVWVGGCPVVRATRRLEPKDVIGCAIDVDCGDVRFSVNGIWATTVPNDEKSGVTVGTCMLSSETFNVGKGVRPCLSVRGSACLSVNFGATPFRHAPPGDGFLPVILRDVHTQPSQSPAEDLPGENLIRKYPVVFPPPPSAPSTL